MSEPKDIKNEYPSREITVIWEPGKCIHSGICASGLPQVLHRQTSRPQGVRQTSRLRTLAAPVRALDHDEPSHLAAHGGASSPVS